MNARSTYCVTAVIVAYVAQCLQVCQGREPQPPALPSPHSRSVEPPAPVVAAPLPSAKVPGFLFEKNTSSASATDDAAELNGDPVVEFRDPQDNDADSGEPFMSRLSRTGTASMKDAYTIFVSLAIQHGRLTSTLDAEQMSFAELNANLQRLCVIGPKFSFAPQDCLQRDTLALMATNYLGCRAGLLTGLFGVTRRYAHREMVYQEVIAPGPPKTLVSGSELLSVTTRISRRVQPNRGVRLTPDEIH